VVACSTTASKNAAGALLGIDLADVTPADITDAVGELVNIIGGNVKGLMPEPSALSLPVVVMNGSSGWPSAVEICQLDGEWMGEPMAVRVLESSIEEKA
jgi:chemotaxis protein CheX